MSSGPVPQQQAPTSLAARRCTSRAVNGINELLTTACRDAVTAANAVTDMVQARGGIDLAVLVRHDGDRWVLTAGSAPPGAALPLAQPLALGKSHVAVAEQPDVVIAVLDGQIAAELRAALQRALVWIALHRGRDVAGETEAAAVREAQALRAVTEQLRLVGDLDQVLHLIASRTLDLLESDICGVLLRDGDVLRMRSCVGHRVIDTARLTMRRGQGVAGRVFADGQVCRVDEYLEDDIISSDFMSLAGREAAFSALAVPMRRQGELIGVLEVWRRRSSVFTDADVARLTTLADFASIAIGNARLLEDQQTSVEELRAVRVALEQEVQISRKTAALQNALLAVVLDNPTIATIAELVAGQMGYAVGIYGPDGRLLASRPEANDGTLPERLIRHPSDARCLVEPGAGACAIALHPVVIHGEHLGAVVLTGADASPELMKIACSQVAMACSLAQLQERVASRARAEALEHAIWDLLKGTLEQRMAARSRAQSMGYQLTGQHRVVSGHLAGLAAGSDTPSAWEHRARSVLRAVRAADVTPNRTVVTLSGDQLVAIVPGAEAERIRALITEWTTAARDQSGEVALTWGVSRSCDDPLELATAYQESQTALTAACRLGTRQVALYDELGIVRLLLGSGSDPDLKAFLDEVTGPLVAYDAEHDGSMMLTLRTFFDANCSQRVAAERLFIHHKTMRYRLERAKQLTGLDLTRHEDRLRADVALRILQMTGQPGQDGAHSDERDY